MVACASLHLHAGDDATTKTLLGDPAKIKVRNLRTINHAGVDYAPTVSADGKTLFFVSERDGSILRSTDGDPSHDFWLVKKSADSTGTFSDPVPLSEINTAVDEGVASISADRQFMYYTVCNSADGRGSCDIWVAQLIGDRIINPRPLDSAVNTKHWESQPYIAPDGSRLYFASNRPRFTGEQHDEDDQDIWYCDWDSKRKEWKRAQNAGDVINTSKRESSPYIAPDSKTLFFSSDGHSPSIGGLDFYYAQRVAATDMKGAERRESWTKPELLPEPINSAADDLFLSMPVSGDVLYFSSRRNDVAEARGDYDIYAASIPKQIRAVNMIVDVRDSCSKGVVPSSVTIKNQLTGRSVSAKVNDLREEVNVVFSDNDFMKDGKLQDTLPVLIEAVLADGRKVNRRLKVPTEALDNTTDIVETIAVDQRKKLHVDYANRATNTPISLNVDEEIVHQQLLQAIFFDKNSAEIPKRYRRLSSDQTGTFAEAFPSRSGLSDYYHILNIVGSRLTKLDELSLVISGHRDEESECDVSLGSRRAESIKSYLVNTWSIDPSRIEIKPAGWPAYRSNPEDSLGAAENRRCELSVHGPEGQRRQFDRPITTTFIRASSSSPTVKFFTGLTSSSPSQEKRLRIRVGDKVVRELKIDPSAQYVTWNVERDAAAIAGSPAGPITVSVVDVISTGRTCPCDTTSLPVMVVDDTTVMAESIQPNVFRVHSFDAQSLDLTESNQRFITDYVLSRVKQPGSLTVTGHTDIVGNYDHNLYLSEKYAQNVAAFISQQGMQVASSDVTGRGEEDPRYSNRYPEARFYNRAVEMQTR